MHAPNTTAPAGHPLPNLARLRDLWEKTGDANLGRLSRGEAPEGMVHPTSAEEWCDAVSSCLMDCYRQTRDESVFAMLFELNQRTFQSFIRWDSARHRIDPQDVLQEAFLKVHRYPDHFRCERPDSFRKWGYRIIKNSLFSHIKRESRAALPVDLEEMAEIVDQTPTPQHLAADRESSDALGFAFLLYLNLYLIHYEGLSPRERRALYLVEVVGQSYRETAEELASSSGTLKMLLFRARRKIAKGVKGTLAELTGGPTARRRAPNHRRKARQAEALLAAV